MRKVYLLLHKFLIKKLALYILLGMALLNSILRIFFTSHKMVSTIYTFGIYMPALMIVALHLFLHKYYEEKKIRIEEIDDNFGM